MLTDQQQTIIKNTLREYRPRYIGVFGSYARREQSPDSDLDLLVEFEGMVDLLTLVHLENRLSELLGVKVDLVTKRALSPYIAPYVEQDVKRIA